jgi:aminodeoxyfutalosine synthase
MERVTTDRVGGEGVRDSGLERAMSLEELAARIERGETLSDLDARAILETNDLITVGMMADDVRRRMHGSRTTFVRVFELHVDAPPASLPPRVSAGEIRIVGEPRTIEAALASVRAAAALANGLPVAGFSLAALEAVATVTDDLRAICLRLRDAGLEAIADVPLDVVRDMEASVAAARGAGLAVQRLTVSTLTATERIAVAQRARDLQTALSGFRAFAPLPTSTSVAAPTTGYDDVKQVALARMLLTNIESIQVDWVRYGPKLAQVALTVGADDIDAVAAVDPGMLGTRRSPLEEIRGNIRAAGLEAVERDGRFELRRDARAG